MEPSRNESCNLSEFISVAQCQMTPLKAWLHTALGYNHQSFACPSYSLDVWLLWYRIFTNPKSGMKAQISLETKIEPAWSSQLNKKHSNGSFQYV